MITNHTEACTDDTDSVGVEMFISAGVDVVERCFFNWCWRIFDECVHGYKVSTSHIELRESNCKRNNSGDEGSNKLDLGEVGTRDRMVIVLSHWPFYSRSFRVRTRELIEIE